MAMDIIRMELASHCRPRERTIGHPAGSTLIVVNAAAEMGWVRGVTDQFEFSRQRA